MWRSGSSNNYHDNGAGTLPTPSASSGDASSQDGPPRIQAWRRCARPLRRWHNPDHGGVGGHVGERGGLLRLELQALDYKGHDWRTVHVWVGESKRRGPMNYVGSEGRGLRGRGGGNTPGMTLLKSRIKSLLT